MDVLSYTSSSPIPAWAAHIVDTIRSGDPAKARRLFIEAAATTSLDDAIFAVAAVVEPGPSVITLGEMALVFGNPHRDGFGWRCGECLHAFRSGGGRLPVAGVNYCTQRGAAAAAHSHSGKDHAGAVPVKEMTPELAGSRKIPGLRQL